MADHLEERRREKEVEESREQKGHSFDLLAEEMERAVAVAGKDLGLKRPMSFPFSTAESGRDFYGGAERFWQPFSSCKTSSSASMGMRLQFPFTISQWQELQRQALIYKHIMASVPVPPDLLHPSAAKSFPEGPTIYLSPSTTMVVGRVVGGEGGMCMRAYGNNPDPEPGRCRRTDGKKWRCARDAAPDQKYCERHLHRGRPRSRKPVERRGTRSKSINTVVAASPATATATAVTVKSPAVAAAGDGLVPSIELNLPFRSMESNPEPRCQDWMKSYSENLASNMQWEVMQSKIGLKYGTNSDMHHYEELPNLNYTNANDNWCPFLNPNLSSMEETTVADYGEPPRRFIDAWSSENINPTFTNNRDESSISSRDKLPLSTLTLSMSNAIVDGTDIGMKSQPLNWMGPDSPLGGPLAEVLQSSNMTSPRDSRGASSNKNSSDLFSLMSKSCCGSQEASPRDSPSRLVSSPSGVLQKAPVSLSDSSTSSSPTFAAASRSDFAFLWMNLNK